MTNQIEKLEFTDDIRNMYNDRFGMFVHFGLYSIIAGEWKGQRPKEHPLGEWIMQTLQIPFKEYSALTKQFSPDPNWAKELVGAAKNAGMKYIVLTSKHHDGFCLYQTKYSPYNSYDCCGRDLVEELHEECMRQGIRMGLYYSHCLDWAEPDAGGHFAISAQAAATNYNFWDYPESKGDPAEFEAYLRRKAFPQVEEILKKYPDLYLIWFDFPHNITREQSEELRALVKKLAPHCLINSRIAHACEDYASLGDNAIPSVPTNVPTECLVTLNDTWGYKYYDHNWKSSAYMVNLLARSVACDTTLLLNVGPMGDGLLTPETKAILADMGKWTAVNSEALYNMHAAPIRFMVEWGYLAYKNNCIYAYVEDAGLEQFSIAGVPAKVESVTALYSGKTTAFEQQGDTLTVTLPQGREQEVLPVFRIACESTIEPTGKMVQCDKQINLMPIWAAKRNDQGQLEALVVEHSIAKFNGTYGLALDRSGLTAHWVKPEEALVWDVEIRSAGTFEATITTTIEEYTAGVVLKISGNRFTAKLECAQLQEKSRYNLSKTGRDNIRIVNTLGTVEIPAAGSYQISVQPLNPSEKSLRVHAADLYQI